MRLVDSRLAGWLAFGLVLASTLVIIDGKSRQSVSKEDKFSKAISRFGSIMFGAMDRSSNLVFSPISIHQALMLLLLGVQSGTQTDTELLSLLDCGALPSSLHFKECYEQYAKHLALFKQLAKPKKRAANKHKGRRQLVERAPLIDVVSMVITRDVNLLPYYKATVGKYFKNSVKSVKGASAEGELRDEMNKWAKEAGFAGEIVSANEFEAKWRLMLLTAVRLEAAWFQEFEESQQARVFFNHGRENETVAGTLLTRSSVPNVRTYTFAKGDHAKRLGAKDRAHFQEIRKRMRVDYMRFVELPLQGNVSLLIIEPPKWHSDDELKQLGDIITKQVEDGSTVLDLAVGIFDKFADSSQNTGIKIPKFKFESNIDLLKGIDLKRAGLVRTFSKGNKDMHLMLEQPLEVGAASHKALIDLDKNGIKAAAVTKIRDVSSNGEKPEYIQFERPFIFLVRFQKITLFAGQLVELPK